MKRLRTMLVTVLVALAALVSAAPASASIVTDYFLDFESTTLPSGWYVSAGPSADGARVAWPQPTYRGSGSFRLRVSPTMNGATGAWLVRDLPSDAYRVEVDGYLRIEDAGPWGATSAAYVVDMPSARARSGVRVSPTIETRLGFAGTATGPDSWELTPDVNLPLKTWHYLKVVYDQRTQTEELYLNGTLLSRAVVAQGAMPTSARFGVFAGPDAGSWITAYIDNVRLTVSRQPDTLAPSTTATVSGTEGANGWHTSAVWVSLDAYDAGSGVAKTEYSRDGGLTWLPYFSQFLIADEGESRLLYRSSDGSGNVEVAKELVVRVDSIAPSAVIHSPIDGGRYEAGYEAVVSWSAHDSASGIDSIVATAPDGAVLDTSVPGVFEFVVTVTDAAGHSSSATAAYVVEEPAVVEPPAEEPEVPQYPPADDPVTEPPAVEPPASEPAVGDPDEGTEPTPDDPAGGSDEGTVLYTKVLDLPEDKPHARNRTLPVRFWLDSGGAPVTTAQVTVTLAPIDSKGMVSGVRNSAPMRAMKVNPDGKYQFELQLQELPGRAYEVYLEFDDGTEASFSLRIK
jgi:hypothetical protein